MAGRPLMLSPRISCAASGCPAHAPRLTRTDGRPLVPPDWYEVVLGRTVLFAHSRKCAQAIAAGLHGGSAMSDVPVGE